jgi:hypothetical protein
VTVRFRNPWVDPRVLDVRPADAEAYLRDHGWSEAQSAVPGAKRFLSPARGTEREAVLVPEALDDGPLLNLLVECVGKVAAWEGRYAGDVLNELLGIPATTPTNGHPAGKP